LFLLAYITTLFSLEFLFIVVQGEAVQMIYIDNRNYPGESFSFLDSRVVNVNETSGGPLAFYLAMQNAPANVMFYATLLVLTFLSDILVVGCVPSALCTSSSLALALLGHLGSRWPQTHRVRRNCFPVHSFIRLLRSVSSFSHRRHPVANILPAQSAMGVLWTVEISQPG
jgi:hypothetical protein